MEAEQHAQKSVDPVLLHNVPEKALLDRYIFQMRCSGIVGPSGPHVGLGEMTGPIVGHQTGVENAPSIETFVLDGPKHALRRRKVKHRRNRR
jgi:hypothetical protein